MARCVAVATVSHRPTRPYTDVAGRLGDAERFAVRACRQAADVVAFPEMYPLAQAPRSAWSQLAETLDLHYALQARLDPDAPSSKRPQVSLS